MWDVLWSPDRLGRISLGTPVLVYSGRVRPQTNLSLRHWEILIYASFIKWCIVSVSKANETVSQTQGWTNLTSEFWLITQIPEKRLTSAVLLLLISVRNPDVLGFFFWHSVCSWQVWSLKCDFVRLESIQVAVYMADAAFWRKDMEQLLKYSFPVHMSVGKWEVVVNATQEFEAWKLTHLNIRSKYLNILVEWNKTTQYRWCVSYRFNALRVSLVKVLITY